MMEAHRLIMRRSVYLWIGTGCVMAFTLFASGQASAGWLRAMLAVNLAFAVIGTLFGVWVGLTLRRAGLPAPAVRTRRR